MCACILSICCRSLRAGTLYRVIVVLVVARSEPAIVTYTCLLTLFLNQHLLSTHRRYFTFAPKVTLTVVNLDSMHHTILFA